MTRVLIYDFPTMRVERDMEEGLILITVKEPIPTIVLTDEVWKAITAQVTPGQIPNALPMPGTLWEWSGDLKTPSGTYAVAAVYNDAKAQSGYTVLLVRFDPSLPVKDCDVLRVGAWPWSLIPSTKQVPT